MKNILTLLFALISFTASAQITLLGGIGSRVSDSTTYVTSSAVTSAHTNGYHDIWLSNSSNLWWVWNGSAYVNWIPGGNIYNSDGTVTSNRVIDGDNKVIDFTNFDEQSFDSRLMQFDGSENLTMQSNGAGIVIETDSIAIVGNGDVRIHTDDTLEFIAGRWKLNGLSGTTGQVPTIQSDGTVKFASPSGGGATAAGATGNVQYKSNGGGLQAEADLTYDSASNILTVPLLKITSGSPGSGKLLQSDADGDASWVTVSTVIGAQDKWVDASEITSRLTNGSADLARDAAGDNDYDYLAFDQTTQEFAQFNWSPPRNWNNGTVKVIVKWTAIGSPSGGVVWGVSGVAVSDDDALSTALGTAQTVSDTFIANNDLHVTSQSAAITIAGTPADSDLVTFQISRNPADGSDTMTGDARLLGIVITYTLDASTSE